MRRVLAAVGALTCLVLVPLGGARGATSAADPVAVAVIDGKGFGHGVGMAQDGAFWMGKAGAKTDQILGQFYPGTTIGKGSGAVRAVVLDNGPAPANVLLAFPDGGEVRPTDGADAAGFPVKVPAGGQVRVVWQNGRYSAARADGEVALGRSQLQLASSVRPQIEFPTTTTTPPPSTTTSTTSPPSGGTTTTTVNPLPIDPASTTTSPNETTSTTTTPTSSDQPGQPSGASSSGPLWAVPNGNGSGTVALPVRQRRYRGTMEITGTAGTLRAINQVDLETYLKGMGEVRDPSWPPAALRSQAIAARTYALRAMSIAGEICDTQRCQVYLGAQAEYGAMNKAVDDTRGQVLTYRKALATTVYSANGGGFSASREEGFGVTGVEGELPYLRPAPYLTQDPAPWSVTVALTDVAARVGYHGDITGLAVTRTGPSGRALEVDVTGTAGTQAVQGIAFARALGLKSSLYTLRLDQSDVAPPPPPPADSELQAPPDEAAAAVDQVAATTSTSTRPQPFVDRVATSPSSTTANAIGLVFAGWGVVATAGSAVLAALGLRRPRGEHYRP